MLVCLFLSTLDPRLPPTDFYVLHLLNLEFIVLIHAFAHLSPGLYRSWEYTGKKNQTWGLETSEEKDDLQRKGTEPW